MTDKEYAANFFPSDTRVRALVYKKTIYTIKDKKILAQIRQVSPSSIDETRKLVDTLNNSKNIIFNKDHYKDTFHDIDQKRRVSKLLKSFLKKYPR